MDLIAKAWDKVKGEDDAPYASASAALKSELQNRADGIIRKGVTTLEAAGDREPTVFDEFEVEFKKLNTPKVRATEDSPAPKVEPKTATPKTPTTKAETKKGAK